MPSINTQDVTVRFDAVDVTAFVAACREIESALIEILEAAYCPRCGDTGHTELEHIERGEPMAGLGSWFLPRTVRPEWDSPDEANGVLVEDLLGIELPEETPGVGHIDRAMAAIDAVLREDADG